MRKQQNTYDHFQSFVKDKDKAVNHFIDNMLAKTQSMFDYTGLPPTLPQTELEKMLQVNGLTFVTEVNGELYALYGGLGGELDAYNRPTIYTVANPALKLNKNYTVDVDGVLILNDSNANSLLNIIGKYAVLYTDSIISINTASILLRIPMLISASDDKTRDSADLFMQKILDGDFSVIGENAFFKGIQTHNTQSSNATQLTQLIELIQYYKASMYNELGLNANFNMKRERLNTSEVSMNIDILLPYVDNMLAERKNAVERINQMFGTDISVELASSWQITHEVIDHDITDDADEIDDAIETDRPESEDPAPAETDEADDTGDDIDDKDDADEVEPADDDDSPADGTADTADDDADDDDEDDKNK